jgi:hypothetical protein
MLNVTTMSVLAPIKQPNLMLKTQPKQFLGSFPFTLAYFLSCKSIFAIQGKTFPIGGTNSAQLIA